MPKKKAYLVDVAFKLRVVVSDNIDPEDIGNDFDQEVMRKLQEKLSVEGISAVSENIETWQEDIELPAEEDD